MKSPLFTPLLLLLLFNISASAQIGINNVEPNPSSVLDLTSSDKGLLVPRMTTAQRQYIGSPATSLLVFDVTVGKFYYFNTSGQWIPMDLWNHVSSSSISYNGSVSINNAAPDASSVMDLTSTDKGILIPRMTTSQRLAINAPANALLVYDVTDKHFYYYSDSQWNTLDSWNKISGGLTLTGDVTISGTITAANYGGLNVSSEIASAIINKADKSTSVTGTDGLQGGGDLSTNRSISIAPLGVTTAKLASSAVTTDKLAPLGNTPTQTTSVDFTSFQLLTGKTYTYSAYTLNNKNVNHMRPYVRMQVQGMRDSGGSDYLKLELQRSTTSSSSGYTLLSTVIYRLDDLGWTSCIIEHVDMNASTTGTNYYRVVATVTSGSSCNLSDQVMATIYSVAVQ